jgi:esterase/lipase
MEVYMVAGVVEKKRSLGRKVVLLLLALLILVLSYFGIKSWLKKAADDAQALNYKHNESIPTYVARASHYIAEHKPMGSEQEKQYTYPFYFKAQPSCKDTTGVLLLHGLVVNPSNMRDIGGWIHKRYPCANVFSPIMSGHGTTLENATRATSSDWLESTRNAYKKLKEENSKVIVLGYSTGATLATILVGQGFNPDAVVLLAPGIEFKDKFLSFFTPVLSFFDVQFYPKKQESDPFKLRSGLVNYLTQFVALTDQAKALQKRVVSSEVPMLVVGLGGDEIISMERALEYFCHSKTTQLHILKTVSSTDREKIGLNPDQCDFTVVSVDRLSHESHTGLTVSPKNKFINSYDTYCKFMPKEDRVRKRDFYQSNACKDEKATWLRVNASYDKEKKVYEPQENNNFDSMMTEMIAPFLDDYISR